MPGTQDPPREPLDGEDIVLPPERPRRFAWVGTVLSLVLFAASMAVLYRILSEVKLEDVRAAFANASREQLTLAGAFMGASYLLLTVYDVLALRQLKIAMPYRTIALASFTSYAISFTLGFPLVTAGTVRYWIYSPRGISAGKVASVTFIASVTFLLGLGTVVGAGLVGRASALSELNHLSVSLNQLIGATILGAIIVYLVWVGARRRAVRVKRWRLELPSFRVSAGQIMLGVGDVCCAAAVLYVLLPSGYGVAFETFAAVYAFACILGIVSHAPGGLGVFEATMLLAFWRLPYEGMIGALLLFRICYYLVPFVTALLLLGLYEIVTRVVAFRARVERDDNGEPTDIAP